MIDNNASETISNIVTYNSYYGLFLTYVFPILLLVLIVFVIGYLASINRKLKYIFYEENLEEENSETEYIVEDNQEQTNNKTLYDATIVPAVIVSCLIVFLIIMGLISMFN